MKYTFTLILTIIGLVVGIIASPTFDYLINKEWLNISNPEATITGAAIGLPVALIIEGVYGILGMIFGALVGLMIDLIRNKEEF